MVSLAILKHCTRKRFSDLQGCTF